MRVNPTFVVYKSMPKRRAYCMRLSWFVVLFALTLVVRAAGDDLLDILDDFGLGKDEDAKLGDERKDHPKDFDVPLSKGSDLDVNLEKSDASDDAKVNTTVLINTRIERLSLGGYTYTLTTDLTDSEFVYLMVRGFGQIHLSFPDSAVQKEGSGPSYESLAIDALEDYVRIPFLDGRLKKKGQQVRIDSFMENNFISLIVKQASTFQIEFNESLRVICLTDSDYPFQVSIPDDTEVTKDSRIQFILSSSLEDQSLNGHEALDMYINQGTSPPTSHSHDTKSSAIMGSGLIETLTKGDQFFCEDSKCKYSVAISAKGINEISFFPSILANKAKVNFKRMVSLLEELEPGKSVEYEFDVVGTKDNWVFTVVPYEGTVELFVNEDVESNNPKDAQYQAYSTRREDLIITAKEETEGSVNKSTKKFWVMFRNPDLNKPTTFQFRMRRITDGNPLEVMENTSENGNLVKGELLQFILNKRQEDEELIKLELRLEVLSGSAELILKSCYLPTMDCRITKEDYKQLAETDTAFTDDRNALVRVSKWNPASKVHYLSQYVRCVQEGMWEDGLATSEMAYPLSATCTFAIGIRSTEISDDVRTKFKFVAYGHGVLTQLPNSEATLVKVMPKEQKRFEINAGISGKEGTKKQVEVTVVSLTGSCKIYLSKSTKSPSMTDNDAFIMVNNPVSVSLKTLVLKEIVTFGSSNNTMSDVLYVAIEGMSYASVDITPIISYGFNKAPTLERLIENRMLHRQINEAEIGTQIDSKSNEKMVVFSRRFVYWADTRIAAIRNSGELNLVVDSATIGLRICIQEFTPRNIGFDECRFVSTGNHLTVKKTDLFKLGMDTVVVSVQKVAKETAYVRLPIDFSLKLTTDENFTPTELVMPGHSHTSKLHRGMSQEFFVDLNPINSVFTLMFESSDPEMFAEVMLESATERWPIARLDLDKFAVEVKRIANLKKTNCTTVCNVVISVFTKSRLQERFTLTYQRDDVSFILKEGEQLSFPNNRPTLFAFETDGTEPVSFSVHNDRVESSILAKLVDATKILVPIKLIFEISASRFDFKTNIETDPEITIPISSLQHQKPNGLVFFVRPVFKQEVYSTKDQIVIFDHKTRATVHMHAKLLKLKPFYQSKFKVSVGDLSYFQIDLDSDQDFSVILTTSSGQARMFLNHGDGNLPTLKKYWRKTTNLNGDEIVISQAELAKEAGGSRQFYLGVTGIESAKFTLLFLPAFKNLIKVSFQHLLDLKLEEGKNYYFDYLNTHHTYSTLFYAEGSDVEVSALNYNKEDTDFVTMTTDEDNYHQKFVINKGDIPRKKEFNRSVETSTTTVVRVKATHGNGRLNFAIYDPEKPLEVFTEKRFKFSQNNGQTVTFLANLGDQYDEVEVHFRLEAGSVSFWMSEMANSTSTPTSLSSPGEKTVNFKVVNLNQESDLVIFNQLFLTVKSDKFSRYSVLLLPKDKFRQIKAFEPEIIHSSTEKDTYVYYYVSHQTSKSIHNIVMEVIRPEGFNERPDMLFVAESDVVLTTESPYLPMPVNDVFERVTGDFIHFEIRPETRGGYYVLRINKAEFEYPVKVSVSYNDMRNIEVNSLHKGGIPEAIGKSHEYSMFVSEPGEVRIVLESCHDLTVETGRFYGEQKMVPLEHQEDNNEYSFDEKTKITQIKFDQRYVQSAPYLKLSTNRFSKSSVPMELTSKIVRAMFSEPGILKFKIVRGSSEGGPGGKDAAESSAWFATTIVEPDPTYIMLTEFRPSNIELILKDYIQLFESFEDLQNLKLTHRHSKTTGDVSLTVRLPHFKPQFLVDYPEVNHAVMKLSFFVFKDLNFHEKLLECGTACLDSIEHTVKVHTVNFTRETIKDMYTNNYVEITFNSTDLEVLSGSRTMNVFCLLSVRWYNDQDEANQISLNPKYTHVPYFLLSFPYREQSALYIFLAIGLALSILAFAVWTWRHKSGRSVVRRQYQAASSSFGSQKSDDVEISSVSKREWRDEQL